MTAPQYITDSNGNKLSVILPIDAYEDILKQLEELENLEDVRLYDEAKKADDGERILFTDYLKKREAKNA